MSEKINNLGQPVGFDLKDWEVPPPPPQKAMDGRYCRVEPLDTEQHGSALFQANRLEPAGRNWTYLPYGPFETLPGYLDWIDKTCRGNDPLFYAIIDKNRGKAVGLASYLRINPAILIVLLVVGVYIAGFWGLILAAPLTATVVAATGAALAMRLFKEK